MAPAVSCSGSGVPSLLDGFELTKTAGHLQQVLPQFLFHHREDFRVSWIGGEVSLFLGIGADVMELVGIVIVFGVEANCRLLGTAATGHVADMTEGLVGADERSDVPLFASVTPRDVLVHKFLVPLARHVADLVGKPYGQILPPVLEHSATAANFEAERIVKGPFFASFKQDSEAPIVERLISLAQR